MAGSITGWCYSEAWIPAWRSMPSQPDPLRNAILTDGQTRTMDGLVLAPLDGKATANRFIFLTFQPESLEGLEGFPQMAFVGGFRGPYTEKGIPHGSSSIIVRYGPVGTDFDEKTMNLGTVDRNTKC
jgi:hypothetical protein